MSRVRDRAYDASDLKELMDNVGGWAETWDDVLRYLQGPARYDSDFSKKEVPQLEEDIEDLKRKKVPFSADYRKVYEAVTGEKGSGLPEPEGVKRPPVNPVELEDRYLKGLEFPATKDQVVSVARKHKAPDRVMKVLNRLEDETFRNMGMLLEEAGDISWDHD